MEQNNENKKMTKGECKHAKGGVVAKKIKHGLTQDK